MKLFLIVFFLFFQVLPVFAGFGEVRFETQPKDVSIYMENALMGLTPKTIQMVKEGEYKIRLEKKGYFTLNFVLKVKSGRIVKVSKKLVSRENWIQSPVNRGEYFEIPGRRPGKNLPVFFAQLFGQGMMMKSILDLHHPMINFERILLVPLLFNLRGDKENFEFYTNPPDMKNMYFPIHIKWFKLLKDELGF